MPPSSTLTTRRPVVTALVQQHQDKRNTSDRSHVVAILLDVMNSVESAVESSSTPEQTQAQEAQVFQEVLAELGISSCMCDQVLALVKTCCASRMCSCFPR
jgi:hypothetical protein